VTWGLVLFDLDGTLLNTLDDLADAGNAVLAGEGLPGHPVAAYQYLVGEGTEQLVRRMLPPERQEEALVGRCLEALRVEYGRCWAAKTRPYPGVTELLANLIARQQPAAVFSNKPEEFTRLTVNHFLAHARFAAVRGARPGVARKPDPAGALALAAELGQRPVQCLYVGDTGTDMDTAVAAGMPAVGVTWGFRTASELRHHGARWLIDHPDQLLDLL
jgi:phosphoglycolate phosphatase